MKKLRFREKLAYGIGYLGMGLENVAVAGYLTFFATDVLYIKASIIGIVILLPRILDIFTDIIIINFVDRTETRWGKYRPWILSGIPLALCMYLLFCKPVFLTTGTQYVLWISAIMFITAPIFETMFYCPYLTLGTVMSSDEQDRIDLASIRSVFEQFASVVVAGSCMPLVLKFGNGNYHDPAGWRICVIIYALIAVLVTLVLFFSVKERVKVNNQNDSGEDMKLSEKLSAFKHNTPITKTILTLVLLFLPWYCYSTLFNYFCINVLGHEDWVSLLSLCSVLFSVIAAITASQLCRKIERRQVILVGSVLIAVSALILTVVHSFIGMVAFLIIKDCGLILVYVCSVAYLPDLADYTIYKTNKDVTGLINGMTSAFEKLAIAVASYLGTVVLTIGNYDANAIVQTQFTQKTIRWGNVVCFLVCAVLIFVVNFSFRELNRDQLAIYKTQKTDSGVEVQ